MSNTNFYRRYTMKCGPNGGKGFEIGHIHNATEDALHVSFSVEKCDTESPNTAKIQVWNLSPKNLKILDKKDCIVELKAGYGDSLALILVGAVTDVITTADGADRMTEIEVTDGRVALRDAKISVSINGKVNTKDVYKKIAASMGLPITFAKDLSFPNIANGFSFVGKGKQALHKVANYCKHNWTIQNQVIQVTWPGRAINTRGFLLNYETGLIGIPKKITIGSSTQGSEQKTGWEVEYLLNGAIGVNDVVQLQSSVASGYFLVYKVTIDGDNMEGDWMCTAQLLQIAEQPKLDKKASNAKAKSSGKSGSGDIKKGDKVKVTRTTKSGGKTRGYQYSGGTFVCRYDTYDVIQVNGDRVVIGIGKTVTAAVNKKDLAKV